MLKIVSFFSGAGGLDLGFQQAKTKIIWANEYDSSIYPTYIKNLGNHLVTKSIVDIDPEEVPDCDGIIGGPPCQSWSQAGAGRGIDDSRGQLFLNYVNIIKEKIGEVMDDPDETGYPFEDIEYDDLTEEE